MATLREAERAYDAAASTYDALLVDAPRAPLHAAYRRCVRAGHTVVDAGCGTGIDSVFLAGLGARVVGIDISAGMLDIARARAAPAGASVRFVQADIERLGTLLAAPVDGIVSGFAALNTVPDLAGFAAAAHASLQPGGFLVAHVLTPGALFDRLGDLSRGRVASAFGGRQERTRELFVGHTAVSHQLIRPDILYARHFAARFLLEDLQQVGAFIPDDGPSRVPAGLVRSLRRLDHAAARWPWVRTHGRFAILTLRAR
ncbi:MAG: methyltransferase domain-containing protein [Pseudomonadota bacterium]|nr:methyltransferase domain-containing protein [Pseudomonadota bacterium]